MEKCQNSWMFHCTYEVHFELMILVYQVHSKCSLSIQAIIECVLTHPYTHAQMRCRKNSIDYFQQNAHKMHFKPLKSHLKRWIEREGGEQKGGGKNAFNKMLYACRAMVEGKRNAQATVVFSILRIRSELCCLVACRLPAGNINFPRNFMMCDHVYVRPSLSLSLSFAVSLSSVHLVHLQHLFR